jgi:hypothetical protein
MADKVYPLKMESPNTGGTEEEMYPSEMDPTEDGLVAKELWIVADEANPRAQTVQQGVKTDAQHNLLLYDRVSGAHTLASLLGSDTKIRSGRALAGDFSGSPKKAAVTFSTPLEDNNYSVSISAQSDGRAWLAEDMTAAGFVINSQASAPIVGSVLWSAEHNS